MRPARRTQQNLSRAAAYARGLKHVLMHASPELKTLQGWVKFGICSNLSLYELTFSRVISSAFAEKEDLKCH